LVGRGAVGFSGIEGDASASKCDCLGGAAIASEGAEIEVSDAVLTARSRDSARSIIGEVVTPIANIIDDTTAIAITTSSQEGIVEGDFIRTSRRVVDGSASVAIKGRVVDIDGTEIEVEDSVTRIRGEGRVGEASNLVEVGYGRATRAIVGGEGGVSDAADSITVDDGIAEADGSVSGEGGAYDAADCATTIIGDSAPVVNGAVGAKGAIANQRNSSATSIKDSPPIVRGGIGGEGNASGSKDTAIIDSGSVCSFPLREGEIAQAEINTTTDIEYLIGVITT